MQRFFVTSACAVIMLSSTIANAQTAAPDPVKPTTVSNQIAATMAALAERSDAVWNRRDAAGMTALYAADATTTIGAAIQLRGRADILAHFTKSFAGLPEGMTHRTVVKRIETLGDMFAVDSAVSIEMPDGAQGKRVVREFFTFALVRRAPGGWEFVAVRATPLAMAPRANG